MAATFTTKGFCLDPLDILSFRDGRPFGEGSTAKSGLPVPQTLAGALRTALLAKFGCDLGRLGEEVRKGATFAEAVQLSGAPDWIAKTRFRGPWLAVRGGTKADVYLPLPANSRRLKGSDQGCQMPKPVPENLRLPGWLPPEGEERMRPLWSRNAARTERLTGFIALGDLKRWLSGRDVDAGRVVASGEDGPLFGFSERTGIGIDPDSLSVQEGLIYGSGFLALGKGVSFYGEAAVPASAAADAFSGIDVFAFGGEGRRVAFSEVPPVEWPCSETKGADEKSCVLLTTPGFFACGWKPSALAGKLAGAAVAGSVPISGWDLARGGPKPTRFAVPAGSVYFLNERIEGQLENLSECEDDLLVGYGCCLKGVWKDETN
jgi:CRISPR-associated protein Cmr3